MIKFHPGDIVRLRDENNRFNLDTSIIGVVRFVAGEWIDVVHLKDDKVLKVIVNKNTDSEIRSTLTYNAKELKRVKI